MKKPAAKPVKPDLANDASNMKQNADKSRSGTGTPLAHKPLPPSSGSSGAKKG